MVKLFRGDLINWYLQVCFVEIFTLFCDLYPFVNICHFYVLSAHLKFEKKTLNTKLMHGLLGIISMSVMPSSDKKNTKEKSARKNAANRVWYIFWTVCWKLVSRISSKSSSFVPNLRAIHWIEQNLLRFEISTCEHFLWLLIDFIGNEEFTGWAFKPL